MKRIAIIGAGFGGLVLAQELSRLGAVTVFEKARGVGGRMSTRYAGAFYFDHGAQCFTARTPAFQQFLEPFMQSGTVAQWHGNVLNLQPGAPTSPRPWHEPHYVCAPNMNSLCKALAVSLNVRTGTELAPLGEKRPDGWHLYDHSGQPVGVYDWVISTAPPAQTLNLMGSYIPETAPLRTATLKACYALMLGFTTPSPREWIAARVSGSALKWVSVNSSKPGRSTDVSCFVAHSHNDWAEEHVNDDMKAAEAFLLEEFERATGISPRHAEYVATHRWRYSIMDSTPKSGPHLDAQLGIAASSDWCATSRIEEVWEMAMELVANMRRLPSLGQ